MRSKSQADSHAARLPNLQLRSGEAGVWSVALPQSQQAFLAAHGLGQFRKLGLRELEFFAVVLLRLVQQRATLPCLGLACFTEPDQTECRRVTDVDRTIPIEIDERLPPRAAEFLTESSRIANVYNTVLVDVSWMMGDPHRQRSGQSRVLAGDAQVEFQPLTRLRRRVCRPPMPLDNEAFGMGPASV